ncbi:MAG: hypothetical protein GY705_03150 [Bacteroidetes bacterium]|nr:hypothetical protein [Bacteroidota bacterium]
MKGKIVLAFFLGALILACTPKTIEQTQITEEQAPPPPPVDENLSKCPKFSDAPDKDQAENDYVIYRDFLRLEKWDESFELWQKVYAVAPAADGRRNTIFSDGIRFYERFLSQTQDSIKRQEYIERIFQLYDEIESCYPEGGFVAGRKAFDYYYKYPFLADREEIYKLFKESIDKDSIEANDFVINPFAALLTEMFDEGKITVEEAKTYEMKIREIIAHGLANCKGTGCERWKIVEEYAPVRLEAFETTQGFYSCEYYKKKYFPEFEAAPEDCDVIRTVYSRFRWGACPETDELFKAIVDAGNTHCRVEREPSTIQKAYKALQEARYNESISLFEQAVGETDDIERKAKYTLTIAKIFHAHKKNFSKARQYARQAAQIKSGWGEPYMLIGRLYASSGPLCGPGRGWDSQIVTWPAIDMWKKAKRVDPSVTMEANKWINRYSQYMPSVEDIFQRNLKEGESFRVGCWIQENTVIRAAKK